MKYKQKLPADVEAKLDAYIDRITAIKWFQPSADLKREDIDKQVNVVLEAFGVKASIEYRVLKTTKDWDAARGAAWDAACDAARDAACDAVWDAACDAAWDAARGAARDAARDAAWDAVWDAARDTACDAVWDAVWDAARDAAWGAADVLAFETIKYHEKYPNGNFVNIVPLWEAGLYPIGVVDGKFIVYVPASKMEFPSDLV